MLRLNEGDEAFFFSLQDIYAVNDITFHPIHGTLATVGSDGRFSFWDKVNFEAHHPTGFLSSSIDKIWASDNNVYLGLLIRFDPV